MIKKAVLLTTLTPFFMVFSDYTFASSCRYSINHAQRWYSGSSPTAACSALSDYQLSNSNLYRYTTFSVTANQIDFTCTTIGHRSPTHSTPTTTLTRSIAPRNCSDSAYNDAVFGNPNLLPKLTDDQCHSQLGSTVSVTPSQSNTLTAGGTLSTAGGACSVSLSPDPQAFFCYGDPIMCDVDVITASTNEYGSWNPDSSDGDQGTFSVLSFSANEYLQELPGGCSDASSCVTIGDTSYLVDWSKAPDHFSYVGSDGNTYSNPNAGGGSDGGDTGGGDPTDPTNPTDPTDPGGNDGGDSGDDSGGSDGGNDSGDGSGGSSGGGGGGSTVPEFEFDESGIIKAIRSSGQSNRNAIDALSNDVTGSINNQTNELNSTINTETSRLITETDRQTGRITTGITAQTHSIQNTLDNQTRSLNSTLEGLESSLVDAFGDIRIRFSGGGGGSGGGSSDGEGDEEGDGIEGFLDGLVEKLADHFTEDLGDGDDLFNSSGLDETLDGLGEQQEQYNQDVHELMDEIGDGSNSGIADQVTSRLPSLPSGSCTPLEFGPIEISCRPFDLIKSWLTWIVYFWTVVSIVDTFFRSGQRTA